MIFNQCENRFQFSNGTRSVKGLLLYREHFSVSLSCELWVERNGSSIEEPVLHLPGQCCLLWNMIYWSAKHSTQRSRYQYCGWTLKQHNLSDFTVTLLLSNLLHMTFTLCAYCHMITRSLEELLHFQWLQMYLNPEDGKPREEVLVPM